MSTIDKKRNKISWYVKAPGRAIGKARDFYVRSFSNCAGNIGYGGAAACGGPFMPTLPRSFSVNSSASNNDEDFRELIRVASSKSLGKKLVDGGTTVSVVPRSQTVKIWRIDEDKAFDQFGDVKVDNDVLTRSRSCAVSRNSRNM